MTEFSAPFLSLYFPFLIVSSPSLFSLCPFFFSQTELDGRVCVGSAAGSATRFSSFEEPGQFVRIPMSDFDDGPDDGMPDLLRQVRFRQAGVLFRPSVRWLCSRHALGMRF